MATAAEIIERDEASWDEATENDIAVVLAAGLLPRYFKALKRAAYVLNCGIGACSNDREYAGQVLDEITAILAEEGTAIMPGVSDEFRRALMQGISDCLDNAFGDEEVEVTTRRSIIEMPEPGPMNSQQYCAGDGLTIEVKINGGAGHAL